MKRGAPLVEYASSDEENDSRSEVESQLPHAPPPKKLKKLPALPAYLTPQAPVDNPALHQGRRRTTPHVEGQFAAHVYVPLVVGKHSRLHKLLLRIYATVKDAVPSVHPIGFSDTSEDADIEVHISLTRPTYLRAHQRADFKRAVHNIARTTQKFSASFATLSELTNDERTRTFLTLEIGAGHDNLRAMAESLTPTLRSIRQKEFYQDPRFHASIAWALLEPQAASVQQRGSTPASVSDQTEEVAGEPSDHPTAGTAPAEAKASFPTIPRFPPSLVPELRTAFVKELVRVGTFDAEELHVRIGREGSRWQLQHREP
ncbi:hypothetical protein BD413DRAFT_558748 [Trametes elegans]|nr:hypothetical protein BD413DRAFT_558748 [Trametes elegans]